MLTIPLVMNLNVIKLVKLKRRLKILPKGLMSPFIYYIN